MIGIRGVIWDLDETLADTRFLKAARERRDWEYCRKKIHLVKAYPGIIEAYSRVALKYRCAIVTSSPKWYAKGIAENLELQPEVLVAYGDTRQHKPHPAPLLKALKELLLQPDECVVFGDNEKDLEASQRANIPFIAVTWGELSKTGFERIGAATIISKPTSIMRILEG